MAAVEKQPPLSETLPKEQYSSSPRRVLNGLFIVAWVVNIVLLLAAVGYVLSDGWARSYVELLWQVLGGQPVSESVIRDPAQLPWSVKLAVPGTYVAALSLLGMIASLLVGSPGMRKMRTWLLFTTLVAAWMGLIVGWQSLYWYGQQFRLGTHVAEFETFARELDADWPQEDGEFADVGVYLAYPRGVPTTLLMLGEPTLPGTQLQFSSIDRSESQIIRCELAAAERGAWLEWHPQGSQPTSFTDGLDTHHELLQSVQLSPQVFWARYRSGAAKARSSQY